MAKVMVKIQMGFSSQLVMDSAQAQKLLDIISDAITVDVSYDSMELIPGDHTEVVISSLGKHEVVHADAV